MTNRLIALCLLGVLATSCNSQLTEGQSTHSPNKKWLVRLETQSTSPTNHIARITVYDTDVYPALKTSSDPSGTPTASFNVPIGIYARSAELKWNTNNTVLRIEQPEANTKPPIYYTLDLATLSFSKVDK